LKKSGKIFLILVFTLCIPAFAAACADSKDIHEQSILMSICLDKKDDEIYYYAEIANITGSNKDEGKSSSADRKYIFYYSHGKTIHEARRKLYMQLERRAYYGAIRTLILTENFAKEHLVEYLYRLRTDELYRKKTMIVITTVDPEKLFKINNENDISVGFSIEEMLETLDEEGQSFTRTTSRMLENLSSSYTGFLIPCIGLRNNKNSLVGYSVVNGTTINGFIPVEDSKALVFLKTDKPRFFYTVPYRGNEFTIETSLKKRKIEPSYEDGNVSFDLKFDFEAKLLYGDKKTPYNFDDISNEGVTKILTEILKNEIKDAVLEAQKHFKCDYLQFDDEFRVKFPEEFESMDWQNEFPEASVNIDVKVVLSGSWMMDFETDVRK